MTIRNVTGSQSCPACNDMGFTVETRRMRGYGALHNQRVRNYSGGPRPNMRTDYNETYTASCPECEAGRQYLTGGLS